MIRALAVLLTLSLPAQAQQTNCNSHEFVRDYLNKEHGEHVIGRGLNSQGTVIEVYRSSKKETWTVVISNPMLSCIVAEGDYWEVIEPKAEQES